MTKKIVIFLHGVGSSGADLERLGDYWASSMPDVAFLAPNGPFPFDQGNGYQWFSISGVNEVNRAIRVHDARAALDKTLSDLLLEHGATWEKDQIVLVGFSQGTIMSLDVVASNRLPVHAVVGFSGRLASPQPHEVNTRAPLLLIHGKADPVIPFSETEKAAQQLKAQGAKVTTLFEDGIPHTISQQGAERAAQFIRQCFDISE
ncbi:dienelactone hydrolase family protein [Vibrio sp. ABG19]|uniref:alpha/beta hydrolase n=1 Tax=Vibrio sp. ABG19 TaxID=2817385 RepID=UPI00249E25FC|nr:dienelactone hydrolase family protein [Vibrio sp. ABG19]WGY44873.1 dienelactone hydrolase family protein [Vibrio sp. ABG19]